MEFKNNRIFICFTLVLLQLISGWTAPLSSNNNATDNEVKRSFTPEEEYGTTFYFEKPSHWGETIYAYVYSSYVNELTYDAGIPLDPWPGKKMYHSVENNVYNTNLAYKYFNHNSHVIFTDGQNQFPGKFQEGFDLIKDGLYTVDGLQALCKSNERSSCKKNYALIFYEKDPSWEKVYAHYKIGNGEWNDIPGQQIFISPSFQKKYRAVIDLGDATEMTVTFTDNDGHWDNNHGQDYVIQAVDARLVISNKNGSSNAKRSFTPTFNLDFNVYFEKPSHWGDIIYAYIYSDYVSPDPITYPSNLDEWPGHRIYPAGGYGNIYVHGVPRKYFDGDLSHIIFTDGEHQVPGAFEEGFKLVRNALYTENGLTSICPTYTLDEDDHLHFVCGNYIPVYYKPKPNWQNKDINAHYKIGPNGKWTEVPGLKMNPILRFEERVLFIDAGNEHEVTVAFNSEGIWDNNNGQNFKSYSLSEIVHEATI